MEIALGGTGIRRWNQLRPCEIDFKEFVGNDVTTAFVAVEKVMAAGEPKIVHLPSRSIERMSFKVTPWPSGRAMLGLPVGPAILCAWFRSHQRGRWWYRKHAQRIAGPTGKPSIARPDG